RPPRDVDAIVRRARPLRCDWPGSRLNSSRSGTQSRPPVPPRCVRNPAGARRHESGPNRRNTLIRTRNVAGYHYVAEPTRRGCVLDQTRLQVGARGAIKESLMRTTLLATVAAAALVAGTIAVSAQGGGGGGMGGGGGGAPSAQGGGSQGGGGGMAP